MKRLILLTLVCMCAGCGTCWTFTGGYKDYTGGVTICPNQEKSKESGTIAVDVTKDEGGESETVFGLPATDLEKIVELLKEKAGISAKSWQENEHPIKKLKILLGGD